MNHTIATLKLRSAWLAVACGSITAGGVIVACGGGDDTTVVLPPADSGTDSTMKGDSSSGSDSGSGGDTAMGMDAPAETSNSETGTGMDSGHDGGGHEAGGNETGTGGDAGDGGMEAEAAAAPYVPLSLCPTLDSDWALPIDGGAGDYDTRVAGPGGNGAGWGGNIASNPPTGFAEAVTNDCKVGALIDAYIMHDATLASNYINQVTAFNPLFMGCGLPDAGVPSFTQLLPAGAVSASYPFTRGDLDEFARLYVEAVNAQAAINWATNLPPNPDPLSVTQIDQIQSQLAALESAMPGVNQSSMRLTASTCGQDGGADGGDGGGSASEGGTDGGGG